MQEQILPAKESNDLIGDFIKSNKIFSVSRSGLTELIVMYNLLKGIPVKDQTLQDLRIVAGVYKSPIEVFFEEYVSGVSCADLQVAWQGSKVDSIQHEVFKKISPNSIKIAHRSVEPYYFENPWSLALENKKVLVISSISQTIRYQHKKIENVWKNKKMFPKFFLETYDSVQSIGNEGPHSNWKESLEIMKEEISKLEFDIAILGCGGYGMPLVGHIKNKMNKSAIYVGGAIQILFGIKGFRWDHHPEINSFYNENWIRPFDIERPKNAQMAEGGAYW